MSYFGPGQEESVKNKANSKLVPIAVEQAGFKLPFYRAGSKDGRGKIFATLRCRKMLDFSTKSKYVSVFER
jgi:hypothetical protein